MHDQLDQAERHSPRSTFIRQVDSLNVALRDLSLSLLVPASSPKFLKSSLASPAQTIIYDLEDSVHASAKASAREALIEWLAQIPAEGIQGRGLNGLSLAVRPNSPFTAADAEDDVERSNHDVYETLREKSERGRDDESVADIMQVWGSAGARRINDGAGPMMLLPKVLFTIFFPDAGYSLCRLPDR